MSEQKPDEEIIEQLEKGLAELFERLGLEEHAVQVARSQLNLAGYTTFSINGFVKVEDGSSS